MQLAHYFLPGERPCGQLKAFRSSLYSFASAVAELQGVRLVSGSNDAEGRVEIKHEGSWGTICDGGWDPRDAMVVCRMLGFDRALGAPRSARYGQGSGRILLKYVNCEGTEDNLADCAHAGIGRFSCTHTSDAGAICYSGTHPNPFQVRLVGGSNDAEGRVEVMHEGSWGTVCDTWWDLRDARVVCRMLGFDGAVDAPGSAWFGQSSGRILLKYVNCDGTEDNLADCAHSGIGRYSCSHTRDAGAICYSGIRLVGGSNDAEGRVEVMHDGSWGTICHSHWDLRDARVVCRMMGFDGALDARGSARFGQGSGRIILDDVGCEGTEVNVADCAHLGIRVHKCGHDEDAGATCYNGAHPNPFGIRLVGGSSSAKGRVEVLYDGSWGTICDSGWDLRDARVVCRMLGFDGALDATTYARFGQGSWDILNLVGCDGKKDNLADCAYLGIGVNYCRHGKDAGAICYLGAHPNTVGVRLVGGSNSYEGRVEIRYNGTWGTVCNDGWDLQDAKVVCRMLRFVDASTAPGLAQFGEGSDKILLSHVGCDGTEDNLADCAHLGFGVHNCQHNEDAGVRCLLEARLVDGADEYEGRVEIQHEGSWGTVCDDLWDLDDAMVVCRQLGFDGALAALPQARFGQGSGDIFLDGVQCNGTETSLKDCKHKGIGVHDCGHKEDASVSCIHAAHLDLNTPPRLPDRQVTGVLHHDCELNIAADDDDKGDLNLSQFKKEERNINMDIDNVYETPDNEKDLDPDDYILPTRESLSDEYIDMTTVYQTPSVGKDEDIDGYFLP
ncbi:deleted in malignant brain tumors 1 protein-like [Strongylocentrotus purpuratus]|uniref:SRCR domain-containing protein n=1 Tax=Strongylocentrotus purpuratus TaxID=7668 RepID=A0A7M7PGP8_STRPU|nr:deleted in malignant brain tumors 1 protein-like [Strongylocentrotus purpuratus]